MRTDDRYATFAELTAHERAGEDYRQALRDRGSAIVVVAPHGGSIEPGTSELAQAIAGRTFSCYCFEGLKRAGNDALHITSTNFDAPGCCALLSRAQTVLTVHGCRGDAPIVYVGGRHTALKDRLTASLRKADVRAENAPPRHAGRRAANLCNRGRSGRGVQLELSQGLRERLFVGLTLAERRKTTPRFTALVDAVRTVLLSIPLPR